ncbi:MAG: phosphopantetheine-binding protein [Nitrospira sp.]|jgi:acyl carrier protein|nr:phosphopantetheine-binding protein [Nitrospira sp.]
MADQTIVDKITQALAAYLKRDAATIHAAHHLRDDLGLDSMAVIELLYKIEETFDLQIPDQDLSAMTTVGSVAAYVEKRLAPASSTPAASPKPAPTKRTPAAKPTSSSTKKTPAAKPTSSKAKNAPSAKPKHAPAKPASKRKV